MEPADDLMSVGYRLANPGMEYFVFVNKAQSFALKLPRLETPLPVEWYQPFTGQRQTVGALASGTLELTPPAKWGSGPAALHVGTPPSNWRLS